MMKASNFGDLHHVLGQCVAHLATIAVRSAASTRAKPGGLSPFVPAVVSMERVLTGEDVVTVWRSARGLSVPG